MTTNRILARLRRIRWGVRMTLTFGVGASVAANVLHAQHNPISQAISAWPPLALLLTAELVSRVPVHRKALAALRVVATMVIASIAAWVSYWHMAGVAARYGETDATPYLLPISVDGLIVVASICLVELAARIRTIEEPPTAPVTPTVHSGPTDDRTSRERKRDGPHDRPDGTGRTTVRPGRYRGRAARRPGPRRRTRGPRPQGRRPTPP